MRILMIGAHPDDCEYECSGLAVKYVRDGHQVRFLSLCNGDGGHHEMKPADIAARRYGETQVAAKVLGVEYDVWQDSSDCKLIADLPTRERLVRYIRNYKPDMVFCHRNNDYHADHRNAALLVQDASYLLVVPNYCPDTPALPTMPVIVHYGDFFHNPVFVPDVVIDITDTIDLKLKMLDCHVSQVYEWLPYTYGTLHEVPTDLEARYAWLCDDLTGKGISDERLLKGEIQNDTGRFARYAVVFRDAMIARYGERGKTVRYVEAFAISEYGSQIAPGDMDKYFPY